MFTYSVIVATAFFCLGILFGLKIKNLSSKYGIDESS
jgi:hypothetical protein